VSEAEYAARLKEGPTREELAARTYRTEADAQRGWTRWRATGSDAPPGRALVEVMAGQKESAA